MLVVLGILGDTFQIVLREKFNDARLLPIFHMTVIVKGTNVLVFGNLLVVS